MNYGSETLKNFGLSSLSFQLSATKGSIMKFKCTGIAILIFFMAFFLVAGCGSSGGGDSDSPTTDGDGDSAPNILSLSLSQISVKSDNSDSSTITASVLDINNVPIEGVRVTFSSTGGQISASSVLTDADGEAKIIFKSGTVEKKNQTVNITASVADLDPKMIPVQITGTTVTLFTNNTNLEIDPNNSDKAKTSLIITVKDAGSLPVFDAPVTITVVEPESTATLRVLPNGDTNDSTLTGNTNVNGTLTVEVTGTGVGDLKIAVEALGYTATQTYVVGAIGEIFSIIEPLEDIVRLSTGTSLTITVKAPDSGSDYDNVTFATTFGTWDGGTETVVTKPRDTETKVSANLSSANAGFATVQVYYTNEDGHSTKDSLTVAISAPSSEAAKIALQASSTVVAPRTGDTNNTITLRATVRTADDQVVGGAPVSFLIENPTGGGETISPAVVFTNEYGIAETTFTSGSLSSDAQGVTLKASVVGRSDIVSASINIIIGGTASSVVIGQSSEIKSVNEDTAYKLPMSVLVVDSNGNPVSGSQVTLGAWPNRYATGYWIEIEENVCMPSGSRAEIFNEDTNRNSIKDPDEDANDDGELTPSHSSAGSVPDIIITDNNGVAQFNLIYLKSSAGWIEDSITASTVVYGTETQSTYTFWLPWMKNESCNLSDSPYNTISGLISIQAESNSIVADGTSSTPITVTVKNSNGTNVEDGLTVIFTTTAGTLDADATPTIFAATTTNGVATATLTSSNNLSIATITATAGGISGTTTVNFVPGAVATIVLTASPNNLTADGSSTSTIRAVVIDANNNPVGGETISFSFITGTGILSSARAITNSSGIATVIYTSSETDEPDTIITAMSTNGTTPAVDLTIVLIAEQVGAINLSLGSSFLVANGTNSTLITVTVTNLHGEVVIDDTDITFTTTGGDIDNASDVIPGTQLEVTTKTTNGVATAILRSGTVAGQYIITATGGSISQLASIEFVPGAAADVVDTTLSANPTVIDADGASTSLITAIVVDENNNPVVDGTTVNFYTTAGNLSSASSTTANGIATATLTSSTTNETTTVTAIVDSISKTVDVTFGTGPGTGEPVYIAITVDPENIRVKGTGGIESAVIKASVKDENGQPYNDSDYNIKFEILTGPGGGEILDSGDDEFPSVSEITTTAGGIATVSLNSGSISGTVRVKVSVRKDAAGIALVPPLESVSTQIGIEAGDPFNITLYKSPDIEDNGDGSMSWIVSAMVQDQYGNPVADNTGVYFGLVDNAPDGYKSSGLDGATNNVTNTFTSGTNFVTDDGVTQFDTLIILEGNDEGGHIIDVPTDGNVTLFGILNGTDTGLDFVVGNAELGTICGVVPTGNLEPDATCTPLGGTAIKGVAHTRLTWAESAIFEPFYLYAETEGRNLGKTFGKPYSYPGIDPVAIDVTLDPVSVFAGTGGITVNAHFYDGANPAHNIPDKELTFKTDNTSVSGFGSVGTPSDTDTTNVSGIASVSNLDTQGCLDTDTDVTISVSYGQHIGTATLTIKSTMPTANFTSTDLADSNHVSFTDTSETPAGTFITNWSWNFDGVAYSGQYPPTQSFGAAGGYAVTLTVINNLGCTHTTTQVITVPPSQ